MASQEESHIPLSSFRELGRTGIMVAPIGFGGGPLGSEFGPQDEKDGIDAVHSALRRGVNFFDVSPYYGRTRAETVLGKALKRIPRNEFVLSTKVGRYDLNVFDFSAERVVKSVNESMARLGVDYIDVIQCHDIEFGDLDQVVSETIPALCKLKQDGKVGAIGITGYPLEIFPYVLSAVKPGSVDVILSYCNYCLQNSRLEMLLDWLKKEKIGVINAAALSMGLLTDKGPPAWHPASDEITEKVREANVFCKEKGVELASVALSYALHSAAIDKEERIASTLIGINSEETLARNIDIWNRPVGKELIPEIQDILSTVKNKRWDSGRFLA